LLLFLVMGSSVAHAADNGSFAIEPTPAGTKNRSSFELTAAPGRTVRDSLTIRNETAGALAFKIYATDAYDNEAGTFILRGGTEPRRGVGSWVILPFNKVTVPPHGATVVPFTVRVPVSATPGDHAGGIVALSGSASQNTNEGVNVRAGVGARVYLRVAGSLRPHLRLSDAHFAPDVSIGSLFGGANGGRVTYRVHNDGNVRLTPTATVHISGLTDGKRDQTLPELLPDGSALISAPVARARGLGSESVSVSVAAGTVRASSRTSAFVFPYALALGLVALIGALVAPAFRRRRKRVG
jgi:hypothetical protein